MTQAFDNNPDYTDLNSVASVTKPLDSTTGFYVDLYNALIENTIYLKNQVDILKGQVSTLQSTLANMFNYDSTNNTLTITTIDEE